MANVKFSDFAVRTTVPTVDYIVGYQGANNIQIAPTDFLGDYLPLVGGTMIGNTLHGDNVKSIYGTGGDFEIYHSGSTSYIADVGSGDLKVLFSNDFIIEAINGETCATFTENGAVDLYYDNALRLDTTDDGVAIRKDSSGALGPVLLLDNIAGGNGDSSAVVFASGGNTYQRAQIKCTADTVAPHNGSIEFYTGRSDLGTLTEKMRIAYDGNVGIGTTAPGHALHVDMTAAVATNPSYIVSTAGVFEMAIGTQNSPGVKQEAFVGTLGATDFKLKANDTDIGRFTTTKKFVIGRDANPSSTIEVFTGGNSVDAAMLLQHDSFGPDRVVGTAFELGSTQPKGAVAFRSDDDTTGQNYGIGNLIFCVDSVDDNNPVTKSDEKMRITHAGNVGIAVDNPEARLQVNEIPQSGGSTTTAASLAHFVGTTAPSTVNGFATLKLEYPAGAASGDPGAQIMFTQGYHSADPDNTQPVGSLRGYRTGADTTYGGGLQLTYQPNNAALGLLPGITLDGDGNTQFHESIYIADTHYANWGNNSDFKIHHNGSSTYLQNYVGNLTIQQNTDDGTIVFQNDDGLGNLATYFTIDGLDGICRFSKEVFVDDNVKMRFGNGGDLNIYHDTSNSYIDDGGTGNLYIRASERIRMAGINGDAVIIS